MNTKRCLDILMRRLGNRTDPELRATCLEEMQLIQEEDLESMEELPWFLISEEITAFTVPDEPRLVLPSDFLREVEDDNLQLLDEDGTYVDIYKRGYDEGRLEISDNEEPGVPQIYSVRGQYIFLRPAPDREYTVRFPSYYARQEAPSDSESSENKWFKFVPGLMIAKTGVVIAGEHLDNPTLTQLFGAQQQRGMERLINMITAREEANRSRRMG